MKRNSTYTIIASLLLGAAVSPALAEQFFAAQVVTYSPGPGVTAGQGFGLTARVLGGPRGGGPTTGSLDVLTLGVRGAVTLGFNVNGRARRIVNQPGPDFIVFENAFFIGGNPLSSFSELAFVEVSTDGITFARFPNHATNAGPVGPGSGIDPTQVSGLAGVHAVLANIDSNTTDPFDPAAAGGDTFDLSDLAAAPIVLNGQVRLSDIRYVRIVDILGDGTISDSLGNPIYDPSGLNNSCDIDAVSVIHGCTAGDVDGNGALDAADAAALAACLIHPDAVPPPCADVNGDGRIDGEDVPAFAQLLLGVP